MSGFSRIKRTLTDSEGNVILEDNPFIEIAYQKFYYDEEYEDWVQMIIEGYDLPEGSYCLTVDTLGAYGRSHHKFDVETVTLKQVKIK